mmetsp:Transcript_17823/g.25189  ORF Transcript_17823/g.25189 Transcript_17823/m.25189 type:complete len:2374 (+) Transcript_17823:76-7197(+)
MADREAQRKLYAYGEMSNKVQRADRSLSRRARNDEATGEVESLWGRTDVGRMGDRIATDGGDTATSSNNSSSAATPSGILNKRNRPTELKEKMERAASKRKKKEGNSASVTQDDTKSSKRYGMDGILGESGGRGVLDIGDLTGYRPTHAGSKAGYESLLSLIGSKSYLGNQPTAVLTDAVNEVINTLKDDNLRDPERRSILSKLLTGKPADSPTGLTIEQYSTLANLARTLDDYIDPYSANTSNAIQTKEGGTQDDDGNMDDEMGVAVVFDSEDEDADAEGLGVGINNDDDDDGDEVVEVASTSSSEQAQDNGDDYDMDSLDGNENNNNNNNINNYSNSNSNEGEMLVQGIDLEGVNGRKRSSHKDRNRILSVHEIDAHWLQRQLSGRYDDAEECARIANEVLKILDFTSTSDSNTSNPTTSNTSHSLRECENKLLVLLEPELFDLVKLMLNNRVRIWGCISLKRAGDDQARDAVEHALINETTGEGNRVWKELNETAGRAEDWSKERMRGIKDSLRNQSNNAILSNVDSKRAGVGRALDSIGIKNSSSANQSDTTPMDIDQGVSTEEVMEIDLDSLAFRDGARTMSNKKCDLPDKTWRATKPGYEEVHVPAIRSVIPDNEKLLPISDLPKWTHKAFEGMDKLNRIQSKMCEAALYTAENLLLCAPTGAGKTNVAMLTMLNILGQFRKQNKQKNDHDNELDDNNDDSGDSYDLDSFKIVYVAPMKALVQEVVKNFSKRLSAYGVSVRELSGDSSLTRREISETQVLVTTPEKWDVVTRQGEGRAYSQLVRLIILDEIHLLHDDRGPVLESIVSRAVRQVESGTDPVRLVGLSATLPNYDDVATFLRVKPEKGLFHFDHSFRPVPLQMQYLGVTERNAFKRHVLQNEICYDKCVLQRKNGANQVLVFVHSRAETGKTAKALRDLAIERDETHLYVKDGGATQEILAEETAAVNNNDLKEVLGHGFGTHHAGMSRADRELVEDLFADGHIAVLCTTATLAWGVNLPAHAVIIKGTQIYDPSKGKWAELSPLDILQMLGRAGRPQYDSEGEGIIITAHSELQYYLSLTNLQLPVESQMMKGLADHLNAEIVLGTVGSLAEATEWLAYTFLYVRMLQNPSFYGIIDPKNTLKTDPSLKSRRMDLAHSAACILERSHLIRYDRTTGMLRSTPDGRIASRYYISHSSMAMYIRHLRPNMTDIEILRLFSLSGEFTNLTVREEEKLELTKLGSRVPVPIKESPSEPSSKINVLLQAYIGRLKLDGFALASDMAFIRQSAARIMRALFEVALRKSWSHLARLLLEFANMVSHRVWRSQSPLRQFGNVPEVVARKLERKSDIAWGNYSDLTPADLGELVGVPKMGRILHKLVHRFPKLELSAQVQPITRSMLRVELSVLADFEFDIKTHGYVLLFHVFVEDVNGDVILHHEEFTLKSSEAGEEHILPFTVHVLDPLPPLYFVRVLSDRWLHSEAVLPISFGNMVLPPKFPPPTELLDLQPLPPSALGEPSLSRLYTKFREFNPLQTQTFHELFKSDRNVLVCAPSGSGKTVCAEFAILRMLVTNPDGKCVYVAPKDEVANNTFENWKERFGSLLSLRGGVVKLTGETILDLKALASARIVVGTIKQWDAISRRWRQRKAVQTVSLFIVDELHFLGSEEGPTMEIVVSRMRYIASQKPQLAATEGDGKNKNKVGISSMVPLRIIGISASLANAREVGEWMGVPSKGLFNFSPKVRPTPLEIYFQSFDQSNFSSRLLEMTKPVYSAISRNSNGKPSIVFVPSRRQAQLTAIDIMSYNQSLGEEGESFLGHSSKTNDAISVSSKMRDRTLQQVIVSGVGFVHEGMMETDFDSVINLYCTGIITVLVCPYNMCWKMNLQAHLVVIMGTEKFDGRERRYIDYPIGDLLHMMGKASRQSIDSNGKCVILCHTPKKEYLKKLLYDPLPIESHLDHYFHDHFNSEIVTKTIGSMQDAVDYITWSFLYRRLTKNPNYYNLQGSSNVHLSEHMSEMVETVLGDLEESKCCQINDEGDVSPLNLGMIAAYYYIQYTTIELIASSVTAKTKTRGVLEILSAASEFSSLPIRQGEEKAIKILARNVKYALPESAQFHDSNTKALILLQCHFSRKTSISLDLRNDQRLIISESVNLIQAIVDVMSSNGWLKPALAAMELSQMVVQGLWNKDNVLMQIPHFTKEIVERCESFGASEERIESVFDILTLDDDDRNDLLRLSEEKMADVAVFCNSYPNVDVSFEVKEADNIVAGEPVQIVVKLERDIDEDEEMDAEDFDQIGIVSAPLFPKEKREGWWIVIGDTQTNNLMSLKRVVLKDKQKVLLEFLAPEEAGDYNLTLFCMSDSYLGCDQEYPISLNIAAGYSDEEESDDNSVSESE